jgi:hypothetical protein
MVASVWTHATVEPTAALPAAETISLAKEMGRHDIRLTMWAISDVVVSVRSTSS